MATKKDSKIENTKQKPFDFILFITVLIMLALGLVMVLSASAPSSLAETGDDSYAYVRTQTISAIMGIICMFIISKIDYKIYAKFYKLIYIASIIILLLVLVPGLGIAANGAKRWINIGFSSMQPSELTKIGIIVFYSAYLTKNKDKLKDLKLGFFKPLSYLIPIIAILILVQSHLSATIVIIAIACIMMLMAGTRLKYFLTLGSLAVVGGGTALYLMATVFNMGTYRLKRIITFLNPWADMKGDGWQIIQGLYAIGSGGLFGTGLGESKQKYLYIPEPHNDYIFAVLAEELGFIGCVIVIILFAIFIWRGIVIAMKSPDMFGSLLAVGITTLVGIQAIMNIAVVTSSMPNTGVPLPFFSYGGTALLILLCAVRSTTKYITF